MKVLINNICQWLYPKPKRNLTRTTRIFRDKEGNALYIQQGGHTYMHPDHPNFRPLSINFKSSGS